MMQRSTNQSNVSGLKLLYFLNLLRYARPRNGSR